MRSHTLTLLVAAPLSTLAAACGDVMPITQPEPDPLRAVLVKRGFPDNLIRDDGDRYVIDGDMVVLKKDVARLSRSISHPVGPERQYISNRTIWGNGSITIGVDLRGLSAVPDWANALRQSFAEYNALPGHAIHFVERNNDYANVRTRSTYVADTWVAYSYLPLNTKPGDSVVVNTYFDWLGASAKKLVMMHELGHIVGFLHADWVTNHESAPAGTHLIGNTPENDQDSYMQSHSGGIPWTTFPYYDRMALRLAYKGEGPDVTGVLDGSGHPVLSWAPMIDALEYDVFLVNKVQDEQTGLYVDGSWEYVGNTSGTTLTDYGRTFGAVSRPCDPYNPNPAYMVLVSFPGGAVTYGSPFGGACFQ